MALKKRHCTCGKTTTPPYCGYQSHSNPGKGEVKTSDSLYERMWIPPMLKIEPVSNKILLMMLPYWDPLIPAQGIASLKRFLQGHGYEVKAVDANMESIFKSLYDKYFEALKKNIPAKKRGNFYNIGHDVMQNHMMAHINYKCDRLYGELVKVLIKQTFFIDPKEDLIAELGNILSAFYWELEEFLINLLMTENPAFFGLTVYRGNLPASLFAFKLVKEKCPTIKTIMGGSVFADNLAVGSPNYEAVMEATAGYLDKIIIGQGEKLFLKYLSGELPEEQRVYTLKDIDMQVLDFPQQEIPDLSDYDINHYPYMAATGSVSCPFQCSFCNSAIFAGKHRVKNPVQLVDEMAKLHDSYGRQLFFMTDSLLNPVIDSVAEEIIKSDHSFYYDCYFRVEENCNLDKALTWRRGGLYRTRIGVETGSQRILDLMQKGINIDNTRETITNLAYAGIKTTAYLVIGHPGETEEDFQMTLDLLKELKNDIWQAECVPFAYHFTGQFGSDHWADKRKLLYPAWAKDMLIAQTWVVDVEPSRKELCDRVSRFTEYCRELGIPNPYSLSEIYEADVRWQELHKNAVPPLIELLNKDVYVDENKGVKQVVQANNTLVLDESEDFAF
jgi:radical SAM family protein